MDAIKLGVLPAISHSWHNNANSWLLIRAIKTLVNGIKAYFGRYRVSVMDDVTLPLIHKHKHSRFANFLRKPLGAHNINILAACGDQAKYISHKVGELSKSSRQLKVKLALDEGGVEAIPMYFSQNERSKNLNGKASRSMVFPDLPGPEQILCRHLSFAYASGIFGRGKESFATIDSEEKIRATHAKVNNYPIGKYPYKEGYYFSKDKFPEAVEALATKHWDIPDGSEKSYMILTTDHVMALRLKKRGGCMKVIFYEPNDTLRHKTIILSDPSKARNLEIDDFDYNDWQDGCVINIEPVANWSCSTDTVWSDEGKAKVAQCDVRFFGDLARENLESKSRCSKQFFNPNIQKAFNRLDKHDTKRRNRGQG